MSRHEQIRRFLAEAFLLSNEGFPCGDDDSLMDNGVVDSTGILELIQFVEDLLETEIPDEEITPDNFDSVNRIANYIARKAGEVATCG
jgi:acyl carrier protein